jgi:hypothetical protein
VRRFRIRAPQVIHETVDGEVVMVNLETGNYYSLVGTGTRIWDALARAAPLEDVLADLGPAGAEPGGDGRAAVEAFVEELVREGLIVAADGPAPADGAAPADGPTPAAPPAPGGVQGTTSTGAPGRAPFAPPILEKFTDLQALILLDPVHEADEERGWPRPRAAG